MKVKKCFREKIKQSFLGYFFAFLMMISGGFGIVGSVMTQDVYAVPETTEEVNGETTEEEAPNEEETTEENVLDANELNDNKTSNDCQNELGAIGWLVCPTTGKISEAVDWIYDTIEELLVINPVEAKDGTPIYEIWKYCRGITNVIFIVLLLVVIYSQITGVGISNYGLKKALPKLIVAAVLINLSFLICALGIDVSNIVGNGLRSVFSSIEEAVIASMQLSPEAVESMSLTYSELYGALAGGSALAVGAGLIALETGTIWMLIPVVLGAVVAVASGLITIALRQAVVALLVMVAPLAIVANILPNTENLFKKWKKLLIQMLVFYPMFSLLFGASSLAGFAIIASAKDAFWLILGVAVQVFPLFFSWSLMKMSGTFLGTINAKMRGFAARPLAGTRAWADSRRMLTRQRYLASGNTILPSLRLRQYLNNRKVARETEIAEASDELKNRGIAYYRSRRYNKDGTSSKRGEKAAERMGRNMYYSSIVLDDDTNMDKGLSDINANKNAKNLGRLRKIDKTNTDMADRLFAVKQRAELINYENAYWRHMRFEDAMNAHMDDVHGDRETYRKHNMVTGDRDEARARYNMLTSIAENNPDGAKYIMGGGSHAFDTQKKITDGKMQAFFNYTPPTKDVEYRLNEIIANKDNPAEKIDMIIPGLRTFNIRGDTDYLKDYMIDVLNSPKGIELGTYASQSLANFLNMEVKGRDPFLRRFGKFINLETARAYNKNERQNLKVTYDEYIKGEYTELDGTVKPVKRAVEVLIDGTPFDEAEKTTFTSFRESLKNAYKDKDGNIDIERMIEKSKAVDKILGTPLRSASLKYPSGSEQLRAVVGFVTGRISKAKDGKYREMMIWDDDEELKPYEDELRKYYRENTIDYLSGQTPAQLFGLRSDYKNALMMHLSDAYIEADNDYMKNWSNEDKTKHADYMQKWSDIQTRYGDLPAEEAQKKRQLDIDALKKEMAGVEMRRILDSTGKLEQMYRTRRSGNANNSKDWARELFGLDNEAEIERYLSKKSAMQKAQRNGNNTSESDDVKVSSYDKDFVKFVSSKIDKIFDDTRSEDESSFYEKTFEYMKSTYGEDHIVCEMYKRYYEDNIYSDRNDLKEHLINLIQEEDNY